MQNLHISSLNEDFKPLPPEKQDDAEPVVLNLTYWKNTWVILKQKKLVILAMYTILIIVLLAIFVPIISPYSLTDQFLDKQCLGPHKQFWFGTDVLGRDIFVRVFYGARISLAVGFAASVINLFIGVIYGGIAGIAGGRVDNVMMRLVDILYSIPLTLYVILFMVIFGPGLKSIFITLGLVYWVEMARVVRAQVLSLREQEFILAARALGADSKRILFNHIIPNSIGPIIVTLTMNIPSAIFTEAFLSFLGLGVSAPMTSWGILISNALPAIRSYPHILFFPAAIMSITMLAFNFLGDGLRDALDPRLRN